MFQTGCDTTEGKNEGCSGQDVTQQKEKTGMLHAGCDTHHPRTGNGQVGGEQKKQRTRGRIKVSL